jgi:hypothetical protein
MTEEISQLRKYEQRKADMIKYLLMKVDEKDWHGVQDAASDLRDIESEKLGYSVRDGEGGQA